MKTTTTFRCDLLGSPAVQALEGARPPDPEAAHGHVRDGVAGFATFSSRGAVFRDLNLEGPSAEQDEAPDAVRAHGKERRG